MFLGRIGFAFVVIWSAVSIVQAQPYRTGLALPSTELNQKLLSFIQKGDFEKVQLFLPVLKPLLDAFQARYGRDLEGEIRAGVQEGNRDRALLAVQRLAFLDMKDLLQLGIEAAGESPDLAKSKFKAAFLDYLLLSPFIQVKSFSSDQKIKKAFRTATLGLETATPYGGHKGTPGGSADIREIQKLVGQIDAELLLAFPDLK